MYANNRISKYSIQLKKRRQIQKVNDYRKKM